MAYMSDNIPSATTLVTDKSHSSKKSHLNACDGLLVKKIDNYKSQSCYSVLDWNVI